METMLDRIEKALETVLVGIAELKESQRKTDAQILDLKESQKKTNEQMRGTDAKLDRVRKQLAAPGLVQEGDNKLLGSLSYCVDNPSNPINPIRLDADR
jgi:septal ring factor EnvC (AmiA/AmiB activator)